MLVRERLKAGDSDGQVLDFLVARYGEFVLLKPPLSWHTAALWGLPPALLLVGIVAIVVVLGAAAPRRPRKPPTSPPPRKPAYPISCAAKAFPDHPSRLGLRLRSPPNGRAKMRMSGRYEI